VIQLLSVRGGEVQDGETVTFGSALEATGAHLASFLNQYYQARASIPDEVLVADDIPEREALEALLSERAKRRVEIIVPKRGERATLVALAKKNARIAFDEGRAGEPPPRTPGRPPGLLSWSTIPPHQCFDISEHRGPGGRFGRGIHRRSPRGLPPTGFAVEGSDDTGMMREVLERRVSRGLRRATSPTCSSSTAGAARSTWPGRVEAPRADRVAAIGVAKVRNDDRKLRGQERIYLIGLETSAPRRPVAERCACWSGCG
jgi:excinuclease UvrABC nuclease subunit